MQNTAYPQAPGRKFRTRAPLWVRGGEYPLAYRSPLPPMNFTARVFRTCIHQRNRRIFAMIFSPARKRKTPCTQRVHKFYGDECGRKISRIDSDFVYGYRFLSVT
jgi:hypothetical protein